MERKWVDILAYCASAALLVQREPPLYSSLRLLEVLEKLLRFGEEQQLTEYPELLHLADRIVQEKDCCMDDPEAFHRLIEETAVAVMGSWSSPTSKQAPGINLETVEIQRGWYFHGFCILNSAQCSFAATAAPAGCSA